MSQNDPAIKKFPHLNTEHYLQVFKDRCLLKPRHGTASVRVSRETAELVKLFNGRCTVEEVIERHLQSAGKASDEAVCEAIIDINKLISQGIVILEDNAAVFTPVIIDGEIYHYPEAMHVELTTRCNLRCFFCYRNAGRARNEERLPVSKLRKILNQLSGTGLQAVELTGGEPLMHPEFQKILEFCGKTFPVTSILTNGTLINDSLVKKWLPLIDSIALSVSLESHCPEEHDRRTGVKGSFEKTTRAIRILAGYGFKTRTAMAIDAVNWEDIEPTLLLSKKLGASAFTYSAILPFGRAGNEPKLWDLDIDIVWEKEKYLNEAYGDYIHTLDINQKQQLSEPGSCGAGHRAYAMDPTGNVRLCVTFDSHMGVIGSLAEQTPEEVFSHPLTKLSAVIPAPKPEICGNCKFIFFCHNCVLRGFTAYQSLGKSRCAWAQNPDVNQWTAMIEGKPLFKERN